MSELKLIVVPGGETEISPKFLQGMINRMVMGSLKYNKIVKDFPHKIDAIACLHQRLQEYDKTGNTEWLIDAANYAMIEFMLPRHKDAHYRATDSKESPGRILDGEVTKL